MRTNLSCIMLFCGLGWGSLAVSQERPERMKIKDLFRSGAKVSHSPRTSDYTVESCPNFSGIWHGECTGSDEPNEPQQEALVIQQSGCEEITETYDRGDGDIHSVTFKFGANSVIDFSSEALLAHGVLMTDWDLGMRSFRVRYTIAGRWDDWNAHSRSVGNLDYLIMEDQMVSRRNSESIFELGGSGDWQSYSRECRYMRI